MGRADPSSEVTDRVLADAAGLVEDDRALDAIERLSEANRRGRDARIEGALVTARHAAFAELDARTARPSWPPSSEDAFADAVLPEIDPAGLRGATVAAGVLRHGALCVRGLLDPDTAELLRDDIEHAFAAREAARRGELPGAGEGDAWFAPFAPGREKSEGFGQKAFVRTVDSPRALFDVIEAFHDCGLARAARDYLGERPAMVANKWVLRRIPHDTVGTDFHQDGAFLGSGIRALNCWIALSPCGGDRSAPGLDLVPRRLEAILDTGTDGALFPWSVPESVARTAAGDAGVVRPAFDVGDALLFDERLVHRTATGPGLTEDRYAIESWFFAPSTYPDKHVPVVL